MSPPPTREWMEIGVHTELCVGTMRRALSKLDDTLKKELDGLKKEGKACLGINFTCCNKLIYHSQTCSEHMMPFNSALSNVLCRVFIVVTEMKKMQKYAGKKSP